VVLRDPFDLGFQPALTERAGAHAADLLRAHESGLFQHADVLLHARQGHAEFRCELRDGGVRPPELLQHAAPRDVRERGERGIETGRRTLNHMVQYAADGDEAQVQANRRVALAVSVSTSARFQTTLIRMTAYCWTACAMIRRQPKPASKPATRL